MKDIEYTYEIIKEQIIKLKNRIHTLDCLVEEGKQCILGQEGQERVSEQMHQMHMCENAHTEAI